jgi:hypothetical protein
MKISRTIFAGCLLLILNFAVVCYAQEEKKDEAARPPQQQETRPPDVKPEGSAQDNPAQEQSKKQRKDQGKQTKQEDKQQNDEMKRAHKEQGKEQNGQNEQNRASTSGNEHNGNRTAQRIPDDKFRAHFGREHHFRISQPVIVENRPRFQYSGYWFEFVDVWPVDWSYSDDCYVDYIDGEYFLFDVLHPGVRLALVVVF